MWHDFCDWYLEIKKLRFRENSGLDDHWRSTLTVYEATLRLLHPIMPFITEELWQRLIHSIQANPEQPKSISLARYPQPTSGKARPEKEISQFAILQNVVKGARDIRADNKLDPKAPLNATLHMTGVAFKEEDVLAIESIAKLRLEQRHENSQNGVSYRLQIHALLSPEARARIVKQNASLEKAIANSERQLADPVFLGKAPAQVVATLRAKLADYQAQIEKNKQLLEGES